MARPRSFDEDAALSAAMHAFRAHGFRNLSIKDIERATGLTSGSLYNAYRDKEGVFRAAVDHYVRHVIAARLETFAGPQATLDDLKGLLTSLFEMPQADGFGCLVTNSAIEFGSGPSPASDSIRQGLDLVDQAVRAVLRRHLPAEHAETAASRLILLYHGLLAMSRAGRADDAARAAVEAEFHYLKSLQTNQR